MAELLIKIGDNSDRPGDWKDGDIIDAFNDRRIQSVHAEHICLPRNGKGKLAGRTQEGTLPLNNVGRDFLAEACEIMFERLSKYEGRFTRLSDGAEIRVTTGVPFDGFDGTRQHIYIEEWFNRRLRAGKLPVFGPRLGFITYNGRVDLTAQKLARVWAKIEEKTGRSKNEEVHRLWPMQRSDIREHLAVRVVDFTEQEAANLTAPQYELDDDGNPRKDEHQRPIVKAKRNLRTDWREILSDLGVTEAQVLDRTYPVGRDIQIAPGRWRHQSKDQPSQSDRAKLQSKTTGGRLA